MRLHLCRAAVNVGHEVTKDFYWLEFCGKHAIDRGYVPKTVWFSSGGENAAAGDAGACSIM